jgi:hypothetical protein
MEFPLPEFRGIVADADGWVAILIEYFAVTC